MLVLINPTYRNLSSRKDYKGFRFPFIGVRHFWRVMSDGGLTKKEVAHSLPAANKWNDLHTQMISKEIVSKRLFLTNIVKCCYGHSHYPKIEVINYHLQFLSSEIRVLKPKLIVAFGVLSFKILTGEAIKLVDYYEKLQEGAVPELSDYQENITGLGIPLTPCYFPVGRGNPKKAAYILQKVRQLV